MSPMQPASSFLELELADEDATIALGTRLARFAPAAAVVHLHGDLGAGKSTLARAMLRAWGVTSAIRSPTYTLVERYPLADGRTALHLDLYRIGDAGELEFLALDDEPGATWLVEWPQRGGAALPAADLHVHLQWQGHGRLARLQAGSPLGAGWLGNLR